MPKQKTHKGAAKRFKVTGSGKVVRHQSMHSHILTKKNHVLRFLEEGDKVKATVQFRGREMARTDLGHKLIKRLTEDLGEQAVLESSPEMAGNRMHVIYGPPRHGIKKHE